jgi:hypothetical protein
MTPSIRQVIGGLRSVISLAGGSRIVKDVDVGSPVAGRLTPANLAEPVVRAAIGAATRSPRRCLEDS